RRALVGFVYSPFRTLELVTGVIGGSPGVDVRVTDVTEPASPTILFASHEPRRTNPAFTWSEDFRVSGRLWRLEGASLRSFEREVESTRPQLVLAGGLAISTLLVIIVWTLLTVQARARELAHNMTFALRASEERLQLALSSARLALFDWNLDSGIVHLGREWSAMLGGPAEDSNVPVLKLQMLVHPDDREAVDASVKAMLSGERDSYRVEHRVRRRDESWLWIESVARVSERDAAGRARRVSGVNRDITERKAIDEMKREFVATVSHELRSPLTGIVAALGLVREGSTGELPGKAREFVELAYANSERLTTLVNDILDIERLEAGGIQLQLEPVLVDRLLERAIALNAGHAERHGVRFVVATPNSGLKVEADPERLMQVVTNLLSNAAKHSPSGAEVVIEARPSESGARVAVIDHGPGIDPAFRSRLFRKFEQADRTRGGTGLGLAISKGLIERMGGRIGCDSDPGRGSTFWIELPAA
ncbi:MAG TPA: ATP-binding protein, partial [Burkholderiales bacterium]